MKTIFAWLITLMFLGSGVGYAGTYTDSAHGNADGNGVDRTPFPAYTPGNCAHCHEQHASIEGSDTGAANYLLFNTRSTNLSGSAPSGFCFDCHGGSSQTSSITINRSYSKNFGGKSTVDDSTIAAQFNHTASGSSHYLPNIVTQILGKSLVTAANVSWSLNANLDPCDACHNPHIAKRNYPVAFEDTTILKTAISRPSDHDNLWGDDTDERMSSYNYQPPYWSGSTNYEPDEGAVAATSKVNTPDYVTFCTDCHNTSNTITSSNPRIGTGRALRQIDWSVDGDKHGAKNATEYITVDSPYTAGAAPVPGYVLSCLDCHEPHGSTNNVFLIRTEVNDTNLAGSITSFSTASWRYLCARCHDDNNKSIHHDNNDWAYIEQKSCGDCHGGYPITCSNCHYHNSSKTNCNNPALPATRDTF